MLTLCWTELVRPKSFGLLLNTSVLDSSRDFSSENWESERLPQLTSNGEDCDVTDGAVTPHIK